MGRNHLSGIATLAAAALALASCASRDAIAAGSDDRAAAPSGPAIFLHNCDDDDRDGAVDCSDLVVNGDADAKDLARIAVEFPEGAARGSLRVDDAARDRVNVFAKEGGAWRHLEVSSGSAELVSPAEGGKLELGIEARQFADAEWDGSCRVEIDVAGAIRVLPMRVAPWMMLANDRPAKVVYVREFPERNDAMLASLREHVPAAGAELHVIPRVDVSGYPRHEIWLQDTMEIGFTEMPGARMPVVLQANRDKQIDNFSHDHLLGPDFGWFRVGDFRKAYGEGEGGLSWLDWFGNLEVAPPTEAWPLGRIYYGKALDDGQAQLDPRIVAMVAAQKVQGPPLALDVSWLAIKHVDEMVCWIPTGDAQRPYRVLVPSVDAMVALLEEIVASGHGDVPLLEKFEKGATASSLLANATLMDYNRRLQKEHIDANNVLVGSELGVAPADLLPLPALYHNDGLSMVPNLVNSLVVNGTIFLPDPDGPVVDGKDLFEEAALRALADLPQKKAFLDDSQYHKWSGNVHCGTNALREGFPAPWWATSAPE